MNNKRLVLASIILLIFFVPFASAQSPLPKQVQADLLKQEIQAALTAKDFPALLEKVEAYRSLDVTMPPPLIFLESKARYATGDVAGAVKAMEEYFQVADQNSVRYKEALKLYSGFSSRLQKERNDLLSGTYIAGAKQIGPTLGFARLGMTFSGFVVAGKEFNRKLQFFGDQNRGTGYEELHKENWDVVLGADKTNLRFYVRQKIHPRFEYPAFYSFKFDLENDYLSRIVMEIFIDDDATAESEGSTTKNEEMKVVATNFTDKCKVPSDTNLYRCIEASETIGESKTTQFQWEYQSTRIARD